jgi:hypothetical protein
MREPVHKCRCLPGRVGCGERFCPPCWDEHKATVDTHVKAVCVQCGKDAPGNLATTSLSIVARYGRKATAMVCSEECSKILLRAKCAVCEQEKLLVSGCKPCAIEFCEECKRKHAVTHLSEACSPQ